MNLKNNAIITFIIVITSILFIINFKNPEKTKFYSFTRKTEQLSLGNIITYSFISGVTCSSLLRLLMISGNYKENEFNSNSEQINNDVNEYNIENEEEINRPPVRDIRESQPTISVNYRFVDSYNNINKSENNDKTINVNSDGPMNDWFNSENDW